MDFLHLHRRLRYRYTLVRRHVPTMLGSTYKDLKHDLRKDIGWGEKR